MKLVIILNDLVFLISGMMDTNNAYRHSCISEPFIRDIYLVSEYKEITNTHTLPAKSLRNMFNYGNQYLLAQLSAIRGANRPIAVGQSEYFITKSPSGHTNKYIKAKSR